MSLLSVTDKYIAVGKKLQIDLYDYTEHRVIDIPSNFIPKENDQITDIITSSNNKYLAVITSCSKQLIVYDLPGLLNPRVYSLPRSASKIRFTIQNTEILVADKSGDVLKYNIDSTEDPGVKLLGHLSLLLDVLQTNDEKYIITTDRDEKIRVSSYPNTYNIHTYCLGHKEFVNHVFLLPHSNKYLLSTSGDGTIKLWDYVQGKHCYTINTFNDIDDPDLKKEFVKVMDDDGVEVDALPVVHVSGIFLNENTSLIAVTVHSFNKILIYSISFSNKFDHKLEFKLKVGHFPTGIQFNGQTMYVYNNVTSNITFYNVNSNGTLSLDKVREEKVFNNLCNDENYKQQCLENIKILYKRKFDNVQEYQERKRQRIEKNEIKNIE